MSCRQNQYASNQLFNSARRFGDVLRQHIRGSRHHFIVFINHNVIDRARHVFGPHLLYRIGGIKIGTNSDA